MITARDSVLDRISGLDSGADDYISKPFQIEELLARMRAFLEESIIHMSHHKLVYKDLEMDTESRVVKRGNENIELTKKEFDLLLLLNEKYKSSVNKRCLIRRNMGI